MNLEEIFKKGATNNTYRRIDSDYRVNVFLGYNEENQMSMVITEYGKEAKISSSKIISIHLQRREDQKLALSFDLVDESYRSLFLVFCKDIIVTCEKAGSEMAISSAITRWKFWREMFGKRKQSILDQMEIKGLIGEMIVLRDILAPSIGLKDAIESWRGPLLGHKDFEFENTWYEVKSVNENALQVTISSLEQLDASNDGHLFVIRLEDTSSVNVASINLNSIVSQIFAEIEDPDLLELLRCRLENAGYFYDQEYDRYNYVFKGMEKYIVTGNFPCLRRKDVSASIGNAKYTILLNSISAFREV